MKKLMADVKNVTIFVKNVMEIVPTVHPAMIGVILIMVFAKHLVKTER